MSTRMFDMRILGTNFCQWDEEFVINIDCNAFFNEHTVILFEILEFSPMLIMERPELLTHDNLYRVAWAYLRPLGAASVHSDKVKLQLYKYKYQRDPATKFNNAVDPRTPDVLLELAWETKEKLNTFLEIDFEFVKKSDEIIPRYHISRAPWEQERTRAKFSTLIGKKKKQAGPTAFLDKDMTMDQVIRLRRWEKYQ